MRMCGINQVHGGFTHQHTHRVYILHTHKHTDTHSARNTNTEAVPMALKGISQSFWLEHFNRVFYCAHILCRLCSKFSSLARWRMCWWLWHTKLKIHLSQIYPSLSMCVGEYVCGPWSCGVASSSARLLALFGKNRIAAHYARWNSRLEAILAVRRVRTQPQKKCAMFALYLEAVLWVVGVAHTMLDVAALQTSAWHCPCKS